MVALGDISVLKFLFAPGYCLYRHVSVIGYLASFCEKEENVSLLLSVHPKIVVSLTDLVQNMDLSSLAAHVLVNISGSEEGIALLSNLTASSSTDKAFLSLMLDCALDTSSTIAECCTKVLCNMSRLNYAANAITELMENRLELLYSMVDSVVEVMYNKNNQNMEYMAQVIGNLTQIAKFRRLLLLTDEILFHRLLILVTSETSAMIKAGIYSAIKNCTFDIELQGKLLEPSFNILPAILYPLAGPEQIDHKIYDNLPPTIQYLPIDKKRESDADNRKKLIQSLYQLCATSSGRTYLRSKDTYIILKHYYNWETNQANKLICEDVIGLIIRTEKEVGIDNLKELSVPEDITKQFENMDFMDNDHSN